MQEPDLVPARTIALVAALGVVVGAAAVVVSTFLGRVDGALPRKAVAAVGPRGTVETSLLAGGAGRGDDERARHADALRTYGWVDRDAGVARIPIERAIDLVVDASPGARP